MKLFGLRYLHAFVDLELEIVSGKPDDELDNQQRKNEVVAFALIKAMQTSYHIYRYWSKMSAAVEHYWNNRNMYNINYLNIYTVV